MALEHFTSYNQRMSAIARVMGSELKQEYVMMVDDPSADGVAQTMKTNAGKEYGIVNRIGAKFKRHGIFVDKGARHGYGGTKGSKWQNKYGQTVTTNPDSFGKMNTGNSPAKPWLSPTLNKYEKIVADAAAEEFADIAQYMVLESIPQVKVRR